MGNYADLKYAIQHNYNWDNNNNQIEGPDVENCLIALINSLGLGYQYMGVATLTPPTNPGTPDQNVFYLAFDAGVYSNFGGTTLVKGQIGIFAYNGAWTYTVKDTMDFAAIGIIELTEHINANQIDFMQGAFNASGASYNDPTRLCCTKAIPTGWLVGVPEGFLIHEVYYYTYWNSNSDFQLAEPYTTVGGRYYQFKTTYPYARFSIRKPDNSQITVQEFYEKLIINPLICTSDFGESETLVASQKLATKVAKKALNLNIPSIAHVGYELSQSGNYTVAANWSASGDMPVGADLQYDTDYTGNIYCYRRDGTFITRVVAGSQLPSNTAFVRINWITANGAPYFFSGYNYEREILLENRVDALDGGAEKENLSLSAPNKVYLTYRSFATASRYAAKIWLSHLIKNSLDSVRDKNIKFSNGAESFPVGYGNVPEDRTEENRTVDIIAKESFNNTQVGYKVRIASATYSATHKPRILTIGDAVTVGYGASNNKEQSWLPNQYWAFAKMLFEMDKADSGESDKYDALFIGRTHADIEMEYDNQTLSFTACAEAAGNIGINDLWGSAWGSDINPFYDSVNQGFSIAAYLGAYRTMDNAGVRLPSQSANPAGESVVGSDGRTYTIGTKITTQSMLQSYNICTPTHIFINLTQISTLADFQARAAATVSKIQSELGNIPIVWCVVDAAGTFFPNEYKLYNPDDIVFTGLLHFKNLNIYDYLISSVENESNNVYVLGLNFVQPTADSMPTLEFVAADSMFKPNGRGAIGAKVADPSITGPHYHPNNNAHSAWGYALYSMLKYLMAA